MLQVKPIQTLLRNSFITHHLSDRICGIPRTCACTARVLFFFRQSELSPDSVNDKICRAFYAQQVAVQKQITVPGIVDLTAGVRAVILCTCLVHFFDDARGSALASPSVMMLLRIRA